MMEAVVLAVVVEEGVGVARAAAPRARGRCRDEMEVVVTVFTPL